MTTNSKLKVTYAQDTTAPVKQVVLSNATGYKDLVVNLNKNGKAVRLSLKDGSERVHVTVAEIPALIEALQLVAARGVKLSAEDISFAA